MKNKLSVIEIAAISAERAVQKLKNDRLKEIAFKTFLDRALLQNGAARIVKKIKGVKTRRATKALLYIKAQQQHSANW